MRDTIATENAQIEVTTDAAETTEYVTAITVSKEVKRSDGGYGSDSHFASQRVELRPALAVAGNGPEVKAAMGKAARLLDCHLEGRE